MADITKQRQAVASKAVDAATAFVDALYALLKLKDQRAKFTSDFVDADFAAVGATPATNPQLTASLIGTLFDFVVPTLQTNFLDAGNGGRNQQVLLQVRNG